MFARSTTFHGRPEGVEAGIKLVQNEVVPLLDSIEGCRGVSLLVDRSGGECIVTSSWVDMPSMMASDERLRPMRDRGRELMGNSMQVDEWEIAVMHRSHHGECARVTWLEGDATEMAETFRVSVLPRIEDLSGFCSASLLLNDLTGIGCATTCWENRDAMMASADVARDLRETSARELGGTVVDVREFELAYAHLHVPEMA
ncbi:MAG: antibiotic biosynthesis monooxygenase [Marmoricola sp.]